MMDEVFVAKEEKAKPSFNIQTMFGKPKKVAGDVGIEIEIEGSNLPRDEEHIPKGWYYKPDGSLRGLESGEYVLTTPVKFKEVDGMLDKLWAMFKKWQTQMDDSNRTSVHVHLNCQKFYLNRLTSFMALYFIFEEMLTAWCGEHRVGNLFCLRAKDAPGIVSQLKRFITSDGSIHLHDNLHYAGLNAHALTQFGSLEVRSLRGCHDPQTIKEWVGMLQRLYELSAEFEDPRRIIEMFSELGPLAYFDQILGSQAKVLRRDVSYTDQQVRQAMFHGVRLAQDLCYCRDWTKYVNAEIKDDPFGRGKAAIKTKYFSVAESGGVPFPSVATEPLPPMDIDWDVEIVNEETFG